MKENPLWIVLQNSISWNPFKSSKFKKKLKSFNLSSVSLEEKFETYDLILGVTSWQIRSGYSVYSDSQKWPGHIKTFFKRLCEDLISQDLIGFANRFLLQSCIVTKQGYYESELIKQFFRILKERIPDKPVSWDDANYLLSLKPEFISVLDTSYFHTGLWLSFIKFRLSEKSVRSHPPLIDVLKKVIEITPDTLMSDYLNHIFDKMHEQQIELKQSDWESLLAIAGTDLGKQRIIIQKNLDEYILDPELAYALPNRRNPKYKNKFASIAPATSRPVMGFSVPPGYVEKMEAEDKRIERIYESDKLVIKKQGLASETFKNLLNKISDSGFLNDFEGPLIQVLTLEKFPSEGKDLINNLLGKS